MEQYTNQDQLWLHRLYAHIATALVVNKDASNQLVRWPQMDASQFFLTQHVALCDMSAKLHPHQQNLCSD